MATGCGGIAIRFGWGGHEDADQLFSLSVGSAALAAALALSAGSAAAEVTVQLAVPGDPANQPLKTVEISGFEIDAPAVGLTASSIAPQAAVTVDHPLVDWFGGTPPYDVHLSYLGTTWKVATISGTSRVGSTNVHTGTRVLVVSTNPVVPGLKSFPAEGEISFVPGGPDCPRCSLR